MQPDSMVALIIGKNVSNVFFILTNSSPSVYSKRSNFPPIEIPILNQANEKCIR
ncbi:hypothetical protein LguiB_000432 [Lonicera macranthoides]